MRIKRNISLYQILKTHIVRILFYFHSMPLAYLVGRVALKHAILAAQA